MFNISVGMDKYILKILSTVPIFTFAFTLWVIYEALGILYTTGQDNLFFIVLSFQVYINWLAIILVRQNCTTAGNNVKSVKNETDDIIISLYNCDKKHLENNNVAADGMYNTFVTGQYLSKNVQRFPESSVDEDFISNVDVQKIWYCQKCCLNSTRYCYHCPLCNKCVFERDHHCFFLGACISQQNMKHFIVILFYTCLVSLYVSHLICVEMNLYQDIYNFTIIVQHFLPMSFAKWIVGREIMHNLLRITLLNLSWSLALFSLVFMIYYLHLVITGKIWPKAQKYSIHKNHEIGLKKVWKNVSFVFGTFGLINFIVPIPLVNIMLTHIGISGNALKYN